MGIMVNRFGVSYYIVDETDLRRLLQRWAEDDRRREALALQQPVEAATLRQVDDWQGRQ